MWRRVDELAHTLAQDIATFADLRELAVTMTGELADCFQDRDEGVRRIIEAVEQAAQENGNPSARYYAIGRGFLLASEAVQTVDRVAASNWHALAAFVGVELCPDALILDVGSTTVDIIPVRNGRVATSALTDWERLAEGSLLYIGCERTPVCSLVDRLTWRGQTANVMNELFATIGDARTMLGFLAEDPNDHNTADGRARTRPMSVARLARMIGLDRRTFDEHDACLMASEIHESARERLEQAISPHMLDFQTFVLSGHGQDLLPKQCIDQGVDLAAQLGPDVSRCAPAFAVAKLACDNR